MNLDFGKFHFKIKGNVHITLTLACKSFFWWKRLCTIHFLWFLVAICLASLCLKFKVSFTTFCTLVSIIIQLFQILFLQVYNFVHLEQCNREETQRMKTTLTRCIVTLLPHGQNVYWTPSGELHWAQIVANIVRSWGRKHWSSQEQQICNSSDRLPTYNYFPTHSHSFMIEF